MQAWPATAILALHDLLATNQRRTLRTGAENRRTGEPLLACQSNMTATQLRTLHAAAHGCLVGWLVCYLNGWLFYFGWLVDRFFSWLVCRVVGSLVDLLFGWLDGWLVVWLVGWFVGWLVGWLIRRLFDLLVE